MYKIILHQCDNDIVKSKITVYGFLFNIGLGLKCYFASDHSYYSYEIIGMYHLIPTTKTFFKCLFHSWEIKRIA